MRWTSPTRVVPNVPGASEQPSSVQPPGRYDCPPSVTAIWSIDSPERSGMSRYPPLNEPLNAYVMSSSTTREPSFVTSTATFACGRSNDFACATPVRTSATRAAAARASVLRARATGGAARPLGGAGRRCGGCGRLRRRACRGAEVDLRRVSLRLVGLEELPFREPERPCDHDAWERLDRVVIREHGVVVDLPRDRDPILCLGELALQLAKVLVRLELGVGLGDGEQTAERLAQDPLGLTGFGGRSRALRGCARLGDRLERAALVGGVALDGLDEVGDQVVPPLELDLDLRPRVVDAVPQPNETVVEEDQRQQRQHDQHDDHDHGDHVAATLAASRRAVQ